MPMAIVLSVHDAMVDGELVVLLPVDVASVVPYSVDGGTSCAGSCGWSAYGDGPLLGSMPEAAADDVMDSLRTVAIDDGEMARVLTSGSMTCGRWPVGSGDGEVWLRVNACTVVVSWVERTRRIMTVRTLIRIRIFC